MLRPPENRLSGSRGYDFAGIAKAEVEPPRFQDKWRADEGEKRGAFAILKVSARYPSGPRERSAKPPFVGSNPTRASKTFKHLVRFSLSLASIP